MNYFRSYAPAPDETIITAWESQIGGLAESSWLAKILAERGERVFDEFASRYAELRTLPRRSRRHLQRTLARSTDFGNVPSEWRRKLACSVAGAALLLALGQGMGEAATITVTAKTLPGINDGDLKCSLVEAIENANDTLDGQPHTDCAAADTSGPNTIVLPAKSSHTLTAASGYYYGYDTGLPLITSEITIQGNGAKILRSTKALAKFRLIAVGQGGVLTLQGVTLSGGNAPYVNGGAIFNYGNLTIANSVVSASYAYIGGAIFNDTSVPEYGKLTITNSTISGNSARFGGGVASYRGTLSITGGTISKNTARFNFLTYGGGSGGGVLTSGGEDDSISGCIITGNTAAYAGAGVFSRSYLTISNSTISKNSSLGVSALPVSGLGGGVYNADTLNVEGSTITGNKARYGGGVYNFDTFFLSGGAITKNSATKYGGGVYNAYGASLDNPAPVIGNKAPKGQDPNVYPP